jgi:hypothetical protein
MNEEFPSKPEHTLSPVMLEELDREEQAIRSHANASRAKAALRKRLEKESPRSPSLLPQMRAPHFATALAISAVFLVTFQFSRESTQQSQPGNTGDVEAMLEAVLADDMEETLFLFDSDLLSLQDLS